jgi:N-carbamoyl-L-amino-acid hydrolase
VRVEKDKRHEVSAAPCAGWIQDRLAASLASVGLDPVRLPSGAGHDALAAAAEMVLAVEQGAVGEGVVGTVGVLEVRDGTGNVIPGEVAFTVDIRAPRDDLRLATEARVFAQLDAIGARRGVSVEKSKRHEVSAAPCAPWLQERLAASIRSTGSEPVRLPSGAGHDAMILGAVTDVGMLFVRCGAGGVSHNPAETVSAEDVARATAALLDFLRRFEPPRR